MTLDLALGLPSLGRTAVLSALLMRNRSSSPIWYHTVTIARRVVDYLLGHCVANFLMARIGQGTAHLARFPAIVEKSRDGNMRRVTMSQGQLRRMVRRRNWPVPRQVLVDGLLSDDKTSSGTLRMESRPSLLALQGNHKGREYGNEPSTAKGVIRWHECLSHIHIKTGNSSNDWLLTSRVRAWLWFSTNS